MCPPLKPVPEKQEVMLKSPNWKGPVGVNGIRSSVFYSFNSKLNFCFFNDEIDLQLCRATLSSIREDILGSGLLSL